MARTRGLEPTPLEYVRRSCLPDPAAQRHAALYLMRVDGELVSGVLVMFTGEVAYYQKGFTERVSLGTQFLHWEIMRRLRGRGVRIYDFGGVEADLAGSGVSRFKLGFGTQTAMFPLLRADGGGVRA